MEFLDFSNRQNRHVRKEDVGESYLDQMKAKVAEDTNFYPTCHIAAPHGLVNDPNGLYQDKEGWYHIYYQWFPLGTVHGLKHWAYVKTKDFIHYESYGVKMYPDQPYDAFGCYTGMAFQEEEQVHLYYTGIRKEGEQLLPSSVHAVIEEGEIVKTGIIEDVDLTKTTENYRDPFIFKREEDYFMIVGAESLTNEGVLWLSKGRTPTSFERLGTIDLGDYPFGYMLECPNYFEEKDYGVMLFSPQGIQAVDPYDFQNVFSVIYAVGQPLDTEKRVFHYETIYELDKGFDFYAPQIFTDQQGRKLLYGWLGNSKTAYPSDDYQWAHMLTIPREITVENQRILQQPIAEWEQMRGKKSLQVTEKTLTNKAFELVIPASELFKLIIKNEKNECLVFSSQSNEYCLDRSQTTHLYNDQYGQQRLAIRQVETMHDVRIIVDHSSIEIFADNGLTVFTGRFYLEGEWSLEVQGTSVTHYELRRLSYIQKATY